MPNFNDMVKKKISEKCPPRFKKKVRAKPNSCETESAINTLLGEIEDLKSDEETDQLLLF